MTEPWVKVARVAVAIDRLTDDIEPLPADGATPACVLHLQLALDRLVQALGKWTA